jgi:hypothetical protein
MKKAIICGVCAVTFLLLLTPTIPAQQYRLVKDTIEKEFQQQLDVAIAALGTMAEDTAQIEYQKGIVVESFSEMKQIWELGGLDAVPLCFKFLISTLLSLILAAIGTLFGMLFGPLLAYIVKLITAPVVILAKIIAFLFGSNHVIAEYET